MEFIDLHTHSTSSDGTDSPTELIAKAREQGLKGLALTDHDTTDGLDEAEEAARKFGLHFIRGCEISTRRPEGAIHILGYWPPRDNPHFNAFLERLRQSRVRRNERILQKLAENGINLTMEELEAQAKGVVGRPHFAGTLVAKGYAKDLNEAYSVWVGDNGKAYAPKENVPEPEEAVRIMSQCGAAPVLAHPLLKPRPDGWLEQMAKKLKEAGLFGIECWHSAHSPEHVEQIKRIGRQHDLVLTGGSDYHGERKPDIKIGRGRNNNLRIPFSVLQDMEKKRENMGWTF